MRNRIFTVLFVLMLAAPLVRADTLTVIRPYWSDTYYCSQMESEFIGEGGTAEAECETREHWNLYEDKIYGNNFDEVPLGNWTYIIQFGQAVIQQGGCRLIYSSKSEVALLCN